jgi:hypothetical protein
LRYTKISRTILSGLRVDLPVAARTRNQDAAAVAAGASRRQATPALQRMPNNRTVAEP